MQPRPTVYGEVVAWLANEVRELQALLDAHAVDQGESLAYVVFEHDYLAWFCDAVRQGRRNAPRHFVRCVEVLLTTTVVPSADDAIWNLTAICFVDGLLMQGDDDVVRVARPWMGRNTLREFAAVGRFREGGPTPLRR